MLLEQVQNSPQLSAETVIEKNPQVYIAMCAEKDFSRPDGFEEIDAFKNDQVYFIDYSDPAQTKSPETVRDLSKGWSILPADSRTGKIKRQIGSELII